MKFQYIHNNINVLHLDRSLEFYQKALGEVYYFRDDAKRLCRELKEEG